MVYRQGAARNDLVDDFHDRRAANTSSPRPRSRCRHINSSDKNRIRPFFQNLRHDGPRKLVSRMCPRCKSLNQLPLLFQQALRNSAHQPVAKAVGQKSPYEYQRLGICAHSVACFGSRCPAGLGAQVRALLIGNLELPTCETILAGPWTATNFLNGMNGGQ